jgi:hypothetical protein
VTEYEAIRVVSAAFGTAWESARPAVPYCFEGELFDAKGVGTWARLSLRHTTSEQLTHGGAGTRRWARRGNLMVQLFAPIDGGRGLLADMAADVRTALEGLSLPGASGEPFVTYAGATREAGTDGAWLMAVVTIPFVYYETR